MASTPLVPATTYPTIVGRLLAQARKKRGVQQAEIAEKLGLKQSAWSKIERGHSPLTVAQLAQVAIILETTPGEILASADTAARYASSRGVVVESDRVRDGVTAGLAILGAAALGGLISAAFKKK